MMHENNMKLQLVSLNKMLLDYSHAHFFRYYLWLLSYYNMNSCSRDTIILIPTFFY